MTIFTVFFFFFFAVLVANFEFAGFAPKQKYTGWTVSMETVRTANPDRERTNQSTGICLRLGLPYNKTLYLYILFTLHVKILHHITIFDIKEQMLFFCFVFVCFFFFTGE